MNDETEIGRRMHLYMPAPHGPPRAAGNARAIVSVHRVRIIYTECLTTRVSNVISDFDIARGDRQNRSNTE